MTGSEFLRKIKNLGRARGVSVLFEPVRGKGSHGMLHYGSKITTIRALKDELKKGTYHAMLKQLGLSEQDLYEV